MNLTNRRFAKFSLKAAIAALALTATAVATQAANLVAYVNMSGYGWVQVVPGSNTGGRAVWSGSRGCHITDRVSRGETVMPVATPSYGGEYAVSFGHSSTTGGRELCWVGLANSYRFVVPAAPATGLYTWVLTQSDYKCLNLPIGRR
jgi:hypothetical protein